MQPRLDNDAFLHSIHYRIRSHECDRQGVVHNARYLEILEIARIEYCRDVLQIPMEPNTFVDHHKFFFVRNAIDYFSPARFDDSLTVLTRVSRIGTTSVTLEQIMDDETTARRVLECEAVMVHVDPLTDEPTPVPAELRARAR